MKRTIFFAGLLLACGAAGQNSYTTQSGLTVTDLSFNSGQWTHGAAERRFVIENPSLRRRTVTVELPGSRYASWKSGVGSLSGTVTVEAGSKASLSLVQPPLVLDGDSMFAISEKGLRRETFACRSKDFQVYSSEAAVSVLLTKSLSAEKLSEIVAGCVSAEEAGSGPSGARRAVRRRAAVASVDALRLERDPGAWSENWLAYAGFDGCMLDAADYARMPEEVRSGLRAYVAAGGSVTFLGAASAPPGWCEPGGVWAPVRGAAGLSETAFGFGRVQAVEAAALSGLSSNQVVSLVAAWAARKAPWFKEAYGHNRPSYTFEESLAAIPVEGGSKVPVNVFLFTLFAFALLAGPGAVFFTARTNRRIWLLAVVPAFSLVFGLAIFAAALLAEGVTPYVRRQAVTLLDQTRRQASTLGALAIYAPTALGCGLAFERGTEVTPLPYGQSSDFKSIEWGRDQLFADGWVRPRMASFFRLRRSEERAERLVVAEQGAEAVEVVNALGAPVSRLLLNDGRGRVYRAENLAPGEKRLLHAGEGAKAAQPEAFEKMRSMYQNASPGWGLAQALEPKAALPQPGARTYVAELAGCPFLENPLRERKVKETAKSLVAGRF